MKTRRLVLAVAFTLVGGVSLTQAQPSTQQTTLSIPTTTEPADESGEEQPIVPVLERDSPTFFHKDEWIILNAVRDRTKVLYDSALNLLLRKTLRVQEREFSLAQPVSRLELFAAPVEFRAKLVKLNMVFLHSDKITPPPACTFDGPLYRILGEDPTTKDKVIVLSPQDPPQAVMANHKCTVVGFFNKLWRFETAEPMKGTGNPESTYLLLVGWVRPYEPRPGTAGEAGSESAGVPPATTGESSTANTFGPLLILVMILIGAYVFIRMKSGGQTSSSFVTRTAPVSLQTRHTSVPNDPAYTAPIDLNGYSKDKKEDDKTQQN